MLEFICKNNKARPLNPPQGDFRTNQSLKSPPAGDLGGEIRLLQLPLYYEYVLYKSPAGRPLEVPVGVDLGGEIRIS